MKAVRLKIDPKVVRVINTPDDIYVAINWLARHELSLDVAVCYPAEELPIDWVQFHFRDVDIDFTIDEFVKYINKN